MPANNDSKTKEHSASKSTQDHSKESSQGKKKWQRRSTAEVLAERYVKLRISTIILALCVPPGSVAIMLSKVVTGYTLLLFPLYTLVPFSAFLISYSHNRIPWWLALSLSLILHSGVVVFTLKLAKKLSPRRAVLFPLLVGLLNVYFFKQAWEIFIAAM